MAEDFMSQLMQPLPDERTQAMVSALRKQQFLGMLGNAIGQHQTGDALEQNARQQLEMQNEAPQRQLRMALEQQQLKKNQEDLTETEQQREAAKNPLVASMWAKKLGVDPAALANMPLRARDELIRLHSQDLEERKLSQGGFQGIAGTPYVFNTRTGEISTAKVSGAPPAAANITGPSLPTGSGNVAPSPAPQPFAFPSKGKGGSDDEEAKAQAAFLKDVTPGRGNPTLTEDAKRIRAADRWLNTAYDPSTGKPRALNNQQIELLNADLSSLMSGGGAAHEGQLNALRQKTGASTFAGALQYVFNHPEDAKAQEFTAGFLPIVQEIKKAAQDATVEEIAGKLPGHAASLKKYPSLWDIVKPHGLSPEMFDEHFQRRTGSVAPGTTIAAPDHAAAVVWANKHLDDPRSATILKLNGVK